MPDAMRRAKSLPPGILREMRQFPEFYQKVWRACAAIPAGEYRTYSWIAARIGKPRAARAVGQALARNPFSPRVPCHRVVGAGGRLIGFSAAGGLKAKRRMLRQEGVDVARLRIE